MSVKYNIQLELSENDIGPLMTMVEGDENEVQKLTQIIQTLLKDVSGGGLMLTPNEMARITESTGLEPTSGEELLPLLAEAAGREEGKLTFRCSVDPVYEDYYQEAATSQGRTVKELIQDIWDIFIDGDPMQYNMGNSGYPHLVRMMPKDKQALETLLGGKFETGTDLVKLIQESLGGGLFQDIAESHTEAV